MRIVYFVWLGLSLGLLFPWELCEAKDSSISVGTIRTTNRSVAQDCMLCHDSQAFHARPTEEFAKVLIVMRDNDPAKFMMMSKILYRLSDTDIREITKLLTTK